MKTFFVQKLSDSKVSCDKPMPIREVQCHENHLRGVGVDWTARAWYVKTEDGKLHGQFESEAAAEQFARTN